ncbi:MAG: TonB family protein [Candidatus Eisenbacteria bacterium]|nr:TonB family protein [Candidatus Eisenbacteria bacterium]
MGTEANRGANRWNLKRALLVSLVLHLLAPILVSHLGKATGWLKAEELPAPERREPIVFEFVEPSPGPEAEVAPESDLVSTKSTEARSPDAPGSERNDLPVSRGESPIKESRPAASAEEPQEAAPAPEKPQEEGESPAAAARPSIRSPSTIRSNVSRSIEESRSDNREGRRAIPGDLSFNTIDFEFAPYLLELKRRIEAHWFPPVAFRGGLPYRGDTVVRFAVDREGNLTLLERVSGADHESLDTAALSAVRFGAPFPPLPENFPEERWVITCTFYYR